MLMATGKVIAGTLEVDAGSLPEGATVTVLVLEGDGTFELSSEKEAALLAAIAEAERGETTSAAQVLSRLGDI